MLNTLIYILHNTQHLILYSREFLMRTRALSHTQDCFTHTVNFLYIHYSADIET